MMSAWLQQPIHAQSIEDLQVMPVPHSSDAEADRACAILGTYSAMGMTDARMTPYIAPCNREPDPDILCSIIGLFNDQHQLNPGLVPPPGGCKSE